MKISQLAVSPAALWVTGANQATIHQQSKYYQLPKKTINSLCQSLEVFLPKLVLEFKKQNHPTFSTCQWLSLTKSIIHSLVGFILVWETVNHARESVNLVDDINSYHNFFPPTQEQLMTRLSFDKKLHDALFSIALSMVKDQPLPNKFNWSPLDLYSLNNITYYLAKKSTSWFWESKKIVKTSSKKTWAVFAAKNVTQYFDGNLAKNNQLTELDAYLQSLYRLPRFPNRKIRQNLSVELGLFLKQAKIEFYLPIFRGKDKIANLATVISHLLPITLVEEFKYYHAAINNQLNEINPTLILTSTGHHQEFANLCLAIADQRHIPIFTFQHGAGYAEYRSMQSERTIETALYRSTYFSWGKNFKPCQGQQKITTVKPLGSPYLQQLLSHHFQTKKINRVLIPLDPIYYYQVLESYIPTPPGLMQSQYQVVVKFIKHLLKEYPQLQILIKTKIGHTHQLGIKHYLSQKELDLVKFTHRGKTYDYFDSQTLIFSPIFSGAINEAMAAEIPFIVYTPTAQSYFRKEIAQILRRLTPHASMASSFSELKTSFQKHYRQQVNYQKLKKITDKYRALASISNPGWRKLFLSNLPRLVQNHRR